MTDGKKPRQREDSDAMADERRMDATAAMYNAPENMDRWIMRRQTPHLLFKKNKDGWPPSCMMPSRRYSA